MSSRPFILLRESDRREILGRVEGRIGDWASHWLPGAMLAPGETLIAIRSALEFYESVTSLRDYRVADAGSGRMACLKVQDPRGFANSLLAASGSDAALALTEVETGLVHAALDDLAGHILGINEFDTRSVETSNDDGGLFDLLRPGASAVYCELSIGAISLSVLLSPEGLHCIWSKPIGPPAEGAITQVREALGGVKESKVKVRAQLPSAEMTLGDLASMNVGDVVRLSARVDEPITVQVGNTYRALRANLGLASGARAFQVVDAASVGKTSRTNSE